MKKMYEVTYHRNDGTFGAYCGESLDAYTAELNMCERRGYEYTAKIEAKMSLIDKIEAFLSNITDNDLKVGSYNVAVENHATKRQFETQGDVHADAEMKTDISEFAKWLANDIMEMDEGNRLYEDLIFITSIQYAGTSNMDLTWDDIYALADGTGYGDPALCAKDNARYVLGNLFFEKGYGDVEACECPEDEIERILKIGGEVLFDENGNITSESVKPAAEVA